MSAFESAGPDPDAIMRHILASFPATDLETIEAAAFFSLDPERHFPNFATIVWADDDYDHFSNLSRPGVFRLNIGVNRATAHDRLAAQRARAPAGQSARGYCCQQGHHRRRASDSAAETLTSYGSNAASRVTITASPRGLCDEHLGGIASALATETHDVPE